MPRKKTAEIEILPPENDQPIKGRKKLVEAEHTIKYSAPVPVTVEEDPEEDNAEEDFDFVEKEKSKRRKKTAKEERDELRREMDKLGVAGVSRLKLSIDKYRHSDSDDSGTLAEKDYCTKYPVTKDHILNDEYMDVARRYGPGRYWFTLRMDNVIARQWERQVNATVTPSGPIIQNVNPADPNSPQVIYQSTNGDGQQQQIPMSIKDIMKTQREALKEQLEMAKLMREAYGFAPEVPATSARSEEEVLASAILKQPEVIENVVGSVIKRFGGKAGGNDDEPSVTAMLMKAVENNQLASSIQAFGNVALAIVDRIFPKWGQNNGQAQNGQTAQAPQAGTAEPRRDVIPDTERQIEAQTGQTHSADQASMGTGQNVSTPEEQALGLLIDHCRRQLPAQIAFNRLINYADAVNEQAPHLSIDGYIDMLGSTPTDAVIEYVKTLPNGEQIAALPHAKEWTADLQKLIRESQGGEEE